MLRGIVYAVMDGATLIIKFIDDSKSRIEAVALEHIVAPKLGSNDGTKPDEANAWNSWEFTRKLCLGKRVMVSLSKNKNDFKRVHPNFGPLNLLFGRVFLFDQDNKDVAIALVESGWAKTRPETKSEDDYVPNLLGFQESAKSDGLGVWSTNGYIRNLPATVDPKVLLSKKTFEGIVETIINGSTYTCWVLPELQNITVQLAGVKSPSAKRDLPEPFGLEAKTFVEPKLLQRVVTINLYAVNENGVFTGSIVHSVAGDIAPLLLREGLAQIFNPTMGLLSNAETYRQDETNAKQAKKNIWKNFDVSVLRSGRVEGQCVSIKGSSGIEIDVGGDVKKVYLSCLRVPQFNPSMTSEPGGFEARELLRKMLVGQRVVAMIDYSQEAKEGSGEKRDYATVFVGSKCANEAVVNAGLGTVFIPKNQKPSDAIDAMLRAEAENKSKKLGLFAQVPPKAVQFNDLSSKVSRTKSIPFLHYLENKRQKGIIEHFSASTRTVILIPSQTCVIRVNMLGLVGTDPSERIGDLGLQYCRSKYLMREVEIIVKDVDKFGNFIGAISLINGRSTECIEADLLRNGFCEIHQGSISKHPCRGEMEEAQEEAQESKKGIWADQTRAIDILAPGKVYEVNIIDIWDSNTLVIQIQSSELTKINNLLLQAKTPVTKVMKNDLVAAVINGKIYRVRVVVVEKDIADVEIIELCRKEKVSISQMRQIPTELASIPPQAIPIKLGGIKAINVNENFEAMAVEYIWSLVEGHTLCAHLMYDDFKEEPSVLLTDSPSVNSGSVNSMMLSKGYSKVRMIEVESPFIKIMEQFAAIENEALENKVGAWVYGNIGDSDDEFDE